MLGHVRGLGKVIDGFGRDDKRLPMRLEGMGHERKGVVKVSSADAKAQGRGKAKSFNDTRKDERIFYERTDRTAARHGCGDIVMSLKGSGKGVRVTRTRNAVASFDDAPCVI